MLFMSTVLTALEAKMYIYIALVAETVLSILFDLFLMADYGFSARLGVNGIAISNIIVNTLTLVLLVLLVARAEVKIVKLGWPTFEWLGSWLRPAAWAGLESFIRNFVFMMMVVRMVNVVSEQGNYWMANNFIWDWLLLPTTALSTVICEETGTDKKNIETKTAGYLAMSVIFVVLWLVSIPVWKPFIRVIMNVEEFEKVYDIALTQTGFFMIFVFNQVCDSTFYGRGRTDQLVVQGLVVDVCYYGVWFGLWMGKVWQPTLYLISMMFGGGMLLDIVPTVVLYILFLKKEELKIRWYCSAPVEDGGITARADDELAVEEDPPVVEPVAEGAGD
jgi:Na+-driven multidrug efflux pump